MRGHESLHVIDGRVRPLLDPAAAFWTYQVNGAHTLGISYPAGSFLLQAPFMALGMNHMVTDWVDLGRGWSPPCWCSAWSRGSCGGWRRCCS